MAQLLEYIKMAVDNIKSNKGRSLLTMLGIIIGISSVILIISIGNGAREKISGDLEGMAGGIIEIDVSDSGVNDENNISKEDIDAIKDQVNNLKGASPAVYDAGTVYVQKGEFNAQYSGVTEDYFDMQSQTLLNGKYFSKSDVDSAQKVGVISENDAIRLFGTVDVVGMEVEVTVQNQTTSITIVGVAKPDDSVFEFAYENMPVTIIMPYSTLESITGNELEPFTIVLLDAESGADTKEILNSALALLKARHHITEDDVYIVEDYNDQIDTMDQILTVLTTFTVFVAAISLFVGGIGVMNIMLVSVTERTREIGIRKALGAKTKSVMLQFLAESAIITLVGGIIGIIFGILGAYAICAIPQVKEYDIRPVLSAAAVLIATGFSSAIGLFFGIYPARKAAKMSPIEALRRD